MPAPMMMPTIMDVESKSDSSLLGAIRIVGFTEFDASGARIYGRRGISPLLIGSSIGGRFVSSGGELGADWYAGGLNEPGLLRKRFDIGSSPKPFRGRLG